MWTEQDTASELLTRPQGEWEWIEDDDHRGGGKWVFKSMQEDQAMSGAMIEVVPSQYARVQQTLDRVAQTSIYPAEYMDYAPKGHEPRNTTKKVTSKKMGQTKPGNDWLTLDDGGVGGIEDDDLWGGLGTGDVSGGGLFDEDKIDAAAPLTKRTAPIVTPTVESDSEASLQGLEDDDLFDTTTPQADASSPLFSNGSLPGSSVPLKATSGNKIKSIKVPGSTAVGSADPELPSRSAKQEKATGLAVLRSLGFADSDSDSNHGEPVPVMRIRGGALDPKDDSSSSSSDDESSSESSDDDDDDDESSSSEDTSSDESDEPTKDKDGDIEMNGQAEAPVANKQQALKDLFAPKADDGTFDHLH